MNPTYGCMHLRTIRCLTWDELELAKEEQRLSEHSFQHVVLLSIPSKDYRFDINSELYTVLAFKEK